MSTNANRSQKQKQGNSITNIHPMKTHISVLGLPGQGASNNSIKQKRTFANQLGEKQCCNGISRYVFPSKTAIKNPTRRPNSMPPCPKMRRFDETVNKKKVLPLQQHPAVPLFGYYASHCRSNVATLRSAISRTTPFYYHHQSSDLPIG